MRDFPRLFLSSLTPLYHLESQMSSKILFIVVLSDAVKHYAKSSEVSKSSEEGAIKGLTTGASEKITAKVQKRDMSEYIKIMNKSNKEGI
jgi:hypothetical protein